MLLVLVLLLVALDKTRSVQITTNQPTTTNKIDQVASVAAAAAALVGKLNQLDPKFVIVAI